MYTHECKFQKMLLKKNDVPTRVSHLTSKLKYRLIPSYLLCTSIIFPFHLLTSPVEPDFPSVSSPASLSFFPCCHRTTTTINLLPFNLRK